MQRFRVGVDIGGTFTDCVAIDGSGRAVTAKRPSTPTDFAQGMIDAIGAVAERLGLDTRGFLQQVSVLAHGTTVGTNAIVQGKGARVGLITTKGHNDVVHIMRGSRGVPRHDIRGIVHFADSHKPDPIVPKRLIAGVSERVDCMGKVIVPLNEAEVDLAIARLMRQDIQAIAICFLWSFLHPEHERRVKQMVRAIAPDLFVSCSVDIAPKWGEYERTTAAVLNSYIGPLTSAYLRSLDKRLKELGYRNTLQITQCGGGSISMERAMEAPLLTLDSGPVSGVIGSQYLASAMRAPNIITTDMGGTSFDVGIIRDGKPTYSHVSNVRQYEYFIPKVDIQAIGAGGGSLVRLNDSNRSITVGPQSAGAVPGAVCYGRGGVVPTVTDAALVLGYLDPNNFAGGRIKLDLGAAQRAIQEVASRLGMGLMESASGIARIVEFGMADIIRKMTVGKGYDPRDFVLFAFGGAGPMHAGVFARELGVQKVIVPQRETASTWCAFGAAAADVLHVHEHVDIMVTPFERERFAQSIRRLISAARSRLASEGVGREDQEVLLSVDMRHKGQINEVEVVLSSTIVPTSFEAELADAFYKRYEELYGRGSSFRSARLEVVTFRARAMANTPRPQLRAQTAHSDEIPSRRETRSRMVYWEELKRSVDTQVFDGMRLSAMETIEGPAVVETPDTSVVVRPGQRLRLDEFGNFELAVGNVADPTRRPAAPQQSEVAA